MTHHTTMYIVRSLLLLVVFSVAGCVGSSNSSLWSERADCDPQEVRLYVQFGFRDVIDTFDGRLQKDLITDGVASIPFCFTLAEQETIRVTMGKIGFFDLPSVFPAPQGQVVSPDAGDRYFIAAFGDRVKMIRWSYDHSSDDEEFQRFSRLVNRIVEMARSRPEYKSLPEASGLYL